MCSYVGTKETFYIVTLVRDFVSTFVKQPIMFDPHNDNIAPKIQGNHNMQL